MSRIATLPGRDVRGAMPHRLEELFEQLTGRPPEKVIPLKAHASDRQIYRVIGHGKSFCGVLNKDVRENKAFIYFANYFHSKNLPVPEVFIFSNTEDAYLQEDLGDTTVFGLLALTRTEESPFPLSIETLYKKALSHLLSFQLIGSQGLDYNYCHQRQEFDREAMIWDLNYFKNSFLSRSPIVCKEGKLEKDFIALVEFLLQAPSQYFMYRDFQARNIMVKDDSLYFIDFQAGRRGPLQYDVASLLYQSSAAIPDDARERLLSHYLEELKTKTKVTADEFIKFYNGFIVMRIFQALGTYGKQGLESGKDYFVRSIKPALNNLINVFPVFEKDIQLPALHDIVLQMKESAHV